MKNRYRYIVLCALSLAVGSSAMGRQTLEYGCRRIQEGSMAGGQLCIYRLGGKKALVEEVLVTLLDGEQKVQFCRKSGYFARMSDRIRIYFGKGEVLELGTVDHQIEVDFFKTQGDPQPETFLLSNDPQKEPSLGDLEELPGCLFGMSYREDKDLEETAPGFN